MFENIPSHLFQILMVIPRHTVTGYLYKIQDCTTQQGLYCEGIKRNCNLNVESRGII